MHKAWEGRSRDEDGGWEKGEKGRKEERKKRRR